MTYRLLLFLLTALSWLPLRLLYIFADLLAWLAGDVVRYRRRVVADNLSSAFPERSPKEIGKISRQFYHFLADYFVETVKLLSISDAEMRRRMHFENPEILEEAIRSDRDVSVYLGHYCNWEWISSLPLHLSPDMIAGQIYHPLEDKAMDRVFLKLRGRFGAHSIPMASTLRAILTWRREGRRSIVGYIADQAPGYEGIHLFLEFLHHDTPVFTGAERISRKLHAAAFYCHVERPRRGFYTARFIPIADDTSTLPPFELTRCYYRLLEEQICRHPQYWLWSHRRWKRTRAGFEQTYGADAPSRLTHL